LFLLSFVNKVRAVGNWFSEFSTASIGFSSSRS
jgi:hypothetical protein